MSTKLGTFHPWVKRIQVCSNEEPHPFPRGDNYEIAKMHWWNLKIFFSKTTEPISINVGTKYPWVNGFQVCSNENEEPINSYKVNNVQLFFSSLNQRHINDIFICDYWFELFSQVSDVAHGPLVNENTRYFMRFKIGPMNNLSVVSYSYGSAHIIVRCLSCINIFFLESLLNLICNTCSKERPDIINFMTHIPSEQLIYFFKNLQNLYHLTRDLWATSLTWGTVLINKHISEKLWLYHNVV